MNICGATGPATITTTSHLKAQEIQKHKKPKSTITTTTTTTMTIDLSRYPHYRPAARPSPRQAFLF